MFLHRASLPSARVEALTDTLQGGIERSAGTLLASHPTGSAVGAQIAEVLGQSDDQDGQTRKMAMTVVTNALVFQAALAEAEMPVAEQSGATRPVRSPSEFRNRQNFLPTSLGDEWQRILEVNYWPIFHSAGSILRALPTRTAVAVLNALWETAEKLIAGGVTKSHDLTGVVFQRLIADRKFLATYYTRPAAASLLAGLALPIGRPLRPSGWDDLEAVSGLRIGDLACGTGTLLATSYQRLSLLHEVHGGNPEALHPIMMERGLVGLDVLNVAVHLTAAMLAGSFPGTPFEGECLLTMPFGRHDYGICIGSLDLLSEQPSFEIVQAAALTAGGRGEQKVRDILNRVGHRQFDLLIMNPPFTRHGAREGDRTLVHNPAFAAFESSEEDQDEMSKRATRLSRGGSAHGHAGLASYFFELAHRKLARSGTLALVLPLTSMSGMSWEGVRGKLISDYSSWILVTIAGRGSHKRSFSADTGMAECLLVCQKNRPTGEDDRRASYVVLSQQPMTTLEGELIAEAISSALKAGGIGRLEDGPFGGTDISIGATHIGQIIDGPVPSEGPWQIVGISDITLAQTAFQLSRGRLWIEGMVGTDLIEIPMATIGDVSSIGPHDLDITGSAIKADGLPQGPFEKIEGNPQGSAYPCLWNHESTQERGLVVSPDSHCRIRKVKGRVPAKLQERAAERWETASRVHYNRDLRFNSQSIIVATTEQPSLGGRAWPTVILNNDEHVYAFSLWCNSTLGIMCHWWMCNKSQEGRGTTTPTGIPLLPSLNISSLSEEQHVTAERVFEELSDERFLPFDQIDEDSARAVLDRRLIVDVLGLPAELCEPGGPIDLLRQKLASEPQLRADKRTRLVFTDDGEESETR